MDDNVDLEGLVDLGAMGPEPSKNYMEALDLLDNVVRECIYVSKRYAGIPSPTQGHFYASVLFVAMITRGVSLLNLAPHTPWAAKKIEHWDYASMTGIVRTMIELRSAFHYLCVDECSPEEWNCRWNIFNLHDCTSRIRLFDAQGADEEVEKLKVQAEELRERIRTNSFFLALDSKRHKKFLHGQTAYLYPMETLAERAGMELESFRWLYVLFSTHVHALPMSFYRLGGDNPERGRGLPSPAEEGYSSLCLSLAATLTVRTRDDVHKLFEGLSSAKYDGAPRTPVEEEASNNLLEIGEEDSFDASEEMRVVRKRISEDLVAVSYVDISTGAIVFEGEASISGDMMFNTFDPYFWTVLINNRPGTVQQIEKLIDGDFMMRLDPDTRRILFKTRD